MEIKLNTKKRNFYKKIYTVNIIYNICINVIYNYVLMQCIKNMFQYVYV